MAPSPLATREATPSGSSPVEVKTGAPHQRARHRGTHLSDDEILELETSAKAPASGDFDAETNENSLIESGDLQRGNESERNSEAIDTGEPEDLRDVFEAHPKARQAWQEAQAYRTSFATPEEARAATVLLADLNKMDALFFSGHPQDHAELAKAIAQLDEAAFESLAKAMSDVGKKARPQPGSEPRQLGYTPIRQSAVSIPNARMQTPVAEYVSARNVNDGEGINADRGAAPLAENAPKIRDIGQPSRQGHEEFFHATNAAAVQGVVDAIEAQVDRLLPEGISKGARNRMVGEIYRELDNHLGSNRQLARQVKEAFRSGALDADHKRALVSLITGRARQALPAAAKRVLSEWTSTVVAANQDRRSRQRTAERRVDIAGASAAGNESRRAMTPRDVDYTRMSDSDILNL
jgi:hypothetical protein